MTQGGGLKENLGGRRAIFRQGVLFAGGVVLVIMLVLLGLVAAFPFNMPYVDDYGFVGWAAGKESLAPYNLFALFNGHQIVFLRLYAWLSGKFLHFDLLQLSYHSVVTFAFSYFFIVVAYWWTRSKAVKFNFAEKVFLFCILILLFTFRQMQNYTQLTCFPWATGMLFIGLFCLGRLLKGKWAVFICGAAVILAPITVAFGLVVPFYVIMLSLLRILKNRNISKKDFYEISVACVALLVTTVLPSVWAKGAEGISPPGVRDGFLLRAFQDPESVVQFLMVAIANFCVPWIAQKSSYYLGVYLVLPFVLAGFYLVFRQFRGGSFWEKALKLWDENPVLAMGATFMLMLLAGRWVYLGVEGAIEPRYTSASVFFQAGLWIFIWQCDLSKNFRKYFLLAVVAMTLYSAKIGLRQGYDWVYYRHQESAGYVEEFRKHRNEPVDLNNPAVQKIYTPVRSLYPNPEPFLVILNILKEERLSFFRDIPEN